MKVELNKGTNRSQEREKTISLRLCMGKSAQNALFIFEKISLCNSVTYTMNIDQWEKLKK